MKHKEEHISYLHAFLILVLILITMSMFQNRTDINLTTTTTQLEEHLSFSSAHSLPDLNLQETHSQDYVQEQGELRYYTGFLILASIYTALFLIFGTSYWKHKYRTFCGTNMFRQIIGFIQNTDGEKGALFGIKS